MNPFVNKWSRKRIFSKGKLRNCLILVALVIAPLICALVFSDSMMAGITNKYIYLSDGHIQISTKGDGTLPDADQILGNDSIYSVDEVTLGYALMYSSTDTCSISIKGIEQNYFNDLRLEQIEFESETQESTSNLQGISISRRTAKDLNVEVGDKLALMVVPDNADKVLRPVMVRIESIFSSGYDQLDQYLCFVDIEYAKTLFSDPSSTYQEVLVTQPYMERLDEVKGLFAGYSCSTWDQHNVSVYENFVTSRQMILVILLIVVCVAAFYTSSVAQQMVQDSITDIAVVKLAGASDKLVRKWAFTCVFAVTIAGIIAGTVLGLVISFNLSPILGMLSSMGLESLSFYLLDFEMEIPWLSMSGMIAAMLAISALTILFTLRKTRRITPIQLFTSL